MLRHTLTDFCWRQHIFWWRHQKSVKIRPKLKIRQILNRLSSQSGWPIKLKLVHRPVLQTGFGYTCPHSFVLTSAYLMMTSSKICQKLKIRQHDVIKSDFQKKFTKCSSTSYYVCVQRWSHLEHLNGSYSIFRIVRFSMGINVSWKRSRRSSQQFASEKKKLLAKSQMHSIALLRTISNHISISIK